MSGSAPLYEHVDGTHVSAWDAVACLANDMFVAVENAAGDNWYTCWWGYNDDAFIYDDDDKSASNPSPDGTTLDSGLTVLTHERDIPGNEFRSKSILDKVSSCVSANDQGIVRFHVGWKKGEVWCIDVLEAAESQGVGGATEDEVTGQVKPTVSVSRTNITPTENIVFMFSEAVYRSSSGTDGVPYTESNIDNLIVLKEDNSSGTDIGFDATIASNQTVTVNPTSNLAQGDTVYLEVKGGYRNSAQEISSSATTFSINVYNLPGAPRSVGANSSLILLPADTIRVTWSAPASDGGSSITGYTVAYKLRSAATWPASNTVSAGASATSADVGDLTRGIFYDFRVRLTNAAGDGASSSVLSTRKPWVRGAPTGVTVTPIGSGKVRVMWTAPSDNGGSPIINYRIEHKLDSTASWIGASFDTVSGTERIMDVDGLTNGCAYDFRFAARNNPGNAQNDGDGDFSGEVSATPSASTKELVVNSYRRTATDTRRGALNVKLGSAPSSNVTVALTMSQSGVATLSHTSLTFASSDHGNKAVTITPIPGPNTIGSTFTLTLTASSTDSGYNGKSVAVTVTVEDDPDLVVSASTLPLTEGGASVSFTVNLIGEPSDPVTVTVTSADTGAVLAAPTTLTFTASNYTTEQTVVVRGKQDADLANEIIKVSLTASGGGYDERSQTVVVSVTDDDQPGVGLSLDNRFVGIREGESVDLGVRLSSKPSGDVTFWLCGLRDVLTASPRTLTFTTANCGAWHTMTLTAHDDGNTTNDEYNLPLCTSGGGYGQHYKTWGITVFDTTASIVVDRTARLRVAEGTLARLSAAPAGRHRDGDRRRRRNGGGRPDDADVHTGELSRSADGLRTSDAGRRQRRRVRDRHAQRDRLHHHNRLGGHGKR